MGGPIAALLSMFVCGAGNVAKFDGGLVVMPLGLCPGRDLHLRLDLPSTAGAATETLHWAQAHLELAQLVRVAT